jgi:hypothetical protein
MKNVEKIVDEIARTKAKIIECQNRLRELERQKTEAENFNIILLVRGMELEPEKLRAFIEAYQKENASAGAEEMNSAPAGKEEPDE